MAAEGEFPFALSYAQTTQTPWWLNRAAHFTHSGSGIADDAQPTMSAMRDNLAGNQKVYPPSRLCSK
jgi:hypothetical protein